MRNRMQREKQVSSDNNRTKNSMTKINIRSSKEYPGRIVFYFVIGVLVLAIVAITITIFIINSQDDKNVNLIDSFKWAVTSLITLLIGILTIGQSQLYQIEKRFDGIIKDLDEVMHEMEHMCKYIYTQPVSDTFEEPLLIQQNCFTNWNELIQCNQKMLCVPYVFTDEFVHTVYEKLDSFNSIATDGINECYTLYRDNRFKSENDKRDFEIKWTNKFIDNKTKSIIYIRYFEQYLIEFHTIAKQALLGFAGKKKFKELCDKMIFCADHIIEEPYKEDIASRRKQRLFATEIENA